ncbi:hypothetical protein BGY98DRAFT_324495 [Russula aff. rugulosa BPL654]|nr:hypothetical protein BGY98DRAFT_324495 [Russula aff. rugulosa BPL654]
MLGVGYIFRLRQACHQFIILGLRSPSPFAPAQYPTAWRVHPSTPAQGRGHRESNDHGQIQPTQFPQPHRHTLNITSPSHTERHLPRSQSH